MSFNDIFFYLFFNYLNMSAAVIKQPIFTKNTDLSICNIQN